MIRSNCVRKLQFRQPRSVNALSRQPSTTYYQRIPASVIRFNRRIVKPFAAPETLAASTGYGGGVATIDKNVEGETTCTLG
jgi:hypothetical protein